MQYALTGHSTPVSCYRQITSVSRLAAHQAEHARAIHSSSRDDGRGYPRKRCRVLCQKAIVRRARLPVLDVLPTRQEERNRRLTTTVPQM